MSTPPKRFERCVIHIGCIKTGTTSIQKFLSMNREALLAEGVYYPKLAHPQGESQVEFALAFQEAPKTMRLARFHTINTPERQQVFRERLRRQLDSEFDKAPQAKLLVLSSEHFHSNFLSETSIQALKAFLQQWVEHFTVIAYLRRQDEMAMSHYSTLLKDGERKPEVFPSAKGEAPPLLYDFLKLYRRWGSVFGKSRVKLRLFDSAHWLGGKLLIDFCLHAGINPMHKQEPPKENASLNQTGQDFLLQLNEFVPLYVDGKPNKERLEMVKLVSTMCAGQAFRMSRREAQAFYERFKADNETLRGLAFPELQGPLFAEAFDRYPDVNTLSDVKYEAAVGVGLALFRAARKG